jgi:hypothetical protein
MDILSIVKQRENYTLNVDEGNLYDELALNNIKFEIIEIEDVAF